MSQPIVLFNAGGEKVVLYAPTYAAQQVDAGLLFLSPPENSNPTPPPPLVEVSTVVDTSTKSHSEMPVKMLRGLAKSAGITGYTRMNKADLIEALKNG